MPGAGQEPERYDPQPREFGKALRVGADPLHRLMQSRLVVGVLAQLSHSFCLSQTFVWMVDLETAAEFIGHERERSTGIVRGRQFQTEVVAHENKMMKDYEIPDQPRGDRKSTRLNSS